MISDPLFLVGLVVAAAMSRKITPPFVRRMIAVFAEPKMCLDLDLQKTSRK